ncbi:hypothetical protein [Actinomadura atramentaria]|uniref:hypothetical protein n=1 Tax=Actinomadura atramentaria TaxID=1990 RepID=UPI00037AEA94|nr:hypothetical protein [Actinomadura atramentaria]
MSGRHQNTGQAASIAPPPDVDGGLTGLPFAQRERMTFLTHLAYCFGALPGYTTGIAVIDLAPVLNVIPVDRRGRAARGAVTIACDYDKSQGAWCFTWYATKERIGPANNLSTAADLIRNRIERTV